MMSINEGRPVESLERFRVYLRQLARLQVSPAFRDRVDLSGVVQQTLFEACKGMMEDDRPRSEVELAAWLRSILAHNLADGLRKLATQKRDARRERSLAVSIDESSVRLEGWLAAVQSSPSQKVIRHEQLQRVLQAMALLPENQRRAIELHYLEGLPLATVAAQVGGTRAAVAGLLHRGLKSLRSEFVDS